MKTLEKSSAQRYAELIAEELENLEVVLGAVSIEDAAEEITALELEHVEELGEMFFAYLNESCLDIAIRKDTRGEDYESTVEILRTCGGPRCDIIRDTFDGHTVRVQVADSGEVFTKRLTLFNVAAEIDALSENF